MSSFVFLCELGTDAGENCGGDDTDEISVNGKTEYDADVRGVVMNFELFIEESSRFEGWSLSRADERRSFDTVCDMFSRCSAGC